MTTIAQVGKPSSTGTGLWFAKVDPMVACTCIVVVVVTPARDIVVLDTVVVVDDVVDVIGALVVELVGIGAVVGAEDGAVVGAVVEAVVIVLPVGGVKTTVMNTQSISSSTSTPPEVLTDAPPNERRNEGSNNIVAEIEFVVNVWMLFGPPFWVTKLVACATVLVNAVSAGIRGHVPEPLW